MSIPDKIIFRLISISSQYQYAFSYLFLKKAERSDHRRLSWFFSA